MFNGKEMETEKRKPADDGGVSGRDKKRKALDDNFNGGETAVKDEEVEEFLAILSRIHEVARHFKNADGSGRESKGRRSRLRAVLECDEDPSGVKVGHKRDEGAEEENLSFDLNADPDPEREPS